MPARMFKAHACSTDMLYKPPKTKFHSHLTGNASIKPTIALKMMISAIVYAISTALLSNGTSFNNVIFPPAYVFKAVYLNVLIV
jgi:hypothetical protein